MAPSPQLDHSTNSPLEDTHSNTSPPIAHGSIINNHSQLILRPPSHLKDYICNHISLSTDFPLANYFSLSHLSHSHCAFLTNIIAHQEPRSYSQAMKYSEWCNAMAKEIQALESNNTWSLCSLPDGKITHWLNGSTKLNIDPMVQLRDIKSLFSYQRLYSR